jgi:hypothetical protein
MSYTPYDLIQRRHVAGQSLSLCLSPLGLRHGRGAICDQTDRSLAIPAAFFRCCKSCGVRGIVVGQAGCPPRCHGCHHDSSHVTSAACPCDFLVLAERVVFDYRFKTQFSPQRVLKIASFGHVYSVEKSPPIAMLKTRRSVGRMVIYGLQLLCLETSRAAWRERVEPRSAMWRNPPGSPLPGLLRPS